MRFLKFSKKKEPPPQPRTIKRLRPLPFNVDGCNLRYAYSMPLKPTSLGSIDAALGDEEKVVDVTSDGEVITLLHEGTPFATIEDAGKAEMVGDYLRRGDPVHAVLQADGVASLRFYRDMRKGSECNLQTVVTLTSCKSNSRQEALWSMREGQELGCFGSDEIFVCDYFNQGAAVIGKMPSKIVKMTEEHHIRALYLERILQDGEKFIPVVRIYWSEKA